MLGLCWSDIALDDQTLTIQRARVEVTGAGIVEVPPKTERGKRTLPLDDAMVSALRSLRTHRHGSDWQPGRRTERPVLDCGSEHLVVNELGYIYI